MSRTNQQWITTLKQKSESALTELADRLFFSLRKALHNRNGVDESFLQDIVQESVMRILDRIDQFENRSQFLTWATSIAIREAFSVLRRNRWKDISLSDRSFHEEFQVNTPTSNDRSPDRLFDRQTLLESLQQSIDRDLSEKQKTALLAELRGIPLDEIARQLGSNRNAVYKLTHDARKKLKIGLETRGYSAEDVLAISAK